MSHCGQSADLGTVRIIQSRCLELVRLEKILYKNSSEDEEKADVNVNVNLMSFKHFIPDLVLIIFSTLRKHFIDRMGPFYANGSFRC